jgi:hypothetical protein
MNCREFEKSIYLYKELTSPERERMDEHVSHCAVCSQLVDQIIHSQVLIKKVSLHKPEPGSPHQLAQRIMNSVEEEKSTSLLNVLAALVDRFFIRFAIGAVSIFLISFFIYEQQLPSNSTPTFKIRSDFQHGTVLDMGKFMKTYAQQRENKRTEPLTLKYTDYKAERVEKKL